MNLSSLKLCLLWLGLDAVLAFSTNARFNPLAPLSPSTRLFAESENDDDDDDDEDWREFRAKLVMSESSSSSPAESPTPVENSDDVIVDDSDLDGFGALFSESASSTTPSSSAGEISGFTPLDPSQWAYDSGKVIEQGAVILGGCEQDFGFGLRQQYFHKAVILVLDHDENTFTKGVILNRPSDRMMDDDTNEGLKWRVWFGGDVQGLDSLMPDIVCLHSLKSEEAMEASNTVIKNIQWTSFENAKKLVKKGIASGPEDFWLFAGYAGWGPGQLAGELDRNSWYMCATDSQTLLKELSRQSKGVDPRDAGLDTWNLLMNMIGKEDTAKNAFDDLMLKEWSQENLVKFDYGDLSLTSNPVVQGADTSTYADMALSEGLAGTVLRASSADRSPFLLTKQHLHHSLLLVILEDERVSLGCVLNQVSTKGIEVGGSTVPIRYGGDYAVKGQSPMMWIHCSQKLKDAGLGTSVGEKGNCFYTCTQEEAKDAISYNVATPEDFLVLSGICVWPKLGGSLANEVKRGVFEVVPEANLVNVFQTLQKQEILTEENLSKNIAVTNDAWANAAGAGSKTSSKEKSSEGTLTVGIGEGFDEDNDKVVFNSDKLVSELADDALKKWIATFLLGSPTLA